MSIEIVKVVQAFVFIGRDREMYHADTDTPAVARTSNLNEVRRAAPRRTGQQLRDRTRPGGVLTSPAPRRAAPAYRSWAWSTRC